MGPFLLFVTTPPLQETPGAWMGRTGLKASGSAVQLCGGLSTYDKWNRFSLPAYRSTHYRHSIQAWDKGDQRAQCLERQSG